MTFHIFCLLIIEAKAPRKYKKSFSVFILYLSKGRKKKKAKQREKKEDEKDISCVCLCEGGKFCAKKKGGRVVGGIYIFGGKCVEMVEKFCDFSRPTSSPSVCVEYMLYIIYVTYMKIC